MEHLTIIPGVFEVPEIVLGCMRIAKMSLAQAEELVLAAMESGVTMFDHADIYGGGESEALFGKVLARNPGLRDQMILQSKCGIGKGMYDASREHIIQAVEGILSRLGTPRLDVLLLHRPDALMEPDEVAEAFERLAAQGKVRYFGVSNQNAAQMTLLASAMDRPIYFNQMQLSLMHTGMIDAGINVNTRFDGAVSRDGDALDHCRNNNIVIQAWSPFLYGFFEGVFIGNEKFPALNAKLEEVANAKSSTPTAIAAAWILRHPAPFQVIAGTTKPHRIREIAAASGVTLARREWYDLYIAAGNTLP